MYRKLPPELKSIIDELLDIKETEGTKEPKILHMKREKVEELRGKFIDFFLKKN